MNEKQCSHPEEPKKFPSQDSSKREFDTLKKNQPCGFTKRSKILSKFKSQLRKKEQGRENIFSFIPVLGKDIRNINLEI